jgi:Tfp pilus assembly protein PilF
MRLLRGALRVVAAAVVAVAVGVAVNQVLNSGRWNLRWLVAAVVLAATAGGLDLWLGKHAGDHADSIDGQAAGPVLWPGLAGEGGVPLLLGEVTPRVLGVHPSRFDAEGASPYIRRQADDVLEAALLADRGKRLVIVEGPRLSGTTSTLAQAAQACLPDHLAAGFADDPRVPLSDMIAQAGRWAAQAGAAGAVVWLDGLSPGRFSELARVPLGDLPPGVRVLATLDTGELEGLRIPEYLNMLLEQHAARVRLGAITSQERRDLLAENAYAALRPVLDGQEDVFLGRLMVIWGPLRAALTLGGSEQAADRVALLRAVTDWYRVHLPRLLTADVLGHQYRAYRRELAGTAPDSPVSAAGFTEALQWATAAPAAGRPQLADLQDVPGGKRYAPHPLLAVIADDPGEDVSWPVSDILWSYADRFFSGDQRRDIGYTALARGARHAAARLLSHTGTAIAAEAYNLLAALFYEQAEWAASRDWWQRAVAAGDPDQTPVAMYDLGILEDMLGEPDKARDWYQQAIATGQPYYAPAAMISLGILEAEHGEPGKAWDWYQQAIATGHPSHVPGAMVNLGILEVKQGEPDKARDWYRQVIATRHPDHAPAAMFYLGVLEDEQGEPGKARDWYQRAIATGDPDYAPRAMVNLGTLEDEQGNFGQARHWYQQAIATRHPDEAPGAMMSLGILEDEQGNFGQARHWYQQVIATRHPDEAHRAMFNLASLEEQQGDPATARYWYQQAIATNHPDEAPRAMVNLGALEQRQRDPVQARHWYQQAIATSHPGQAPMAMVNLGILEETQGDPAKARYWYQQAIAAGHPETTSLAEQELRTLNRHERERLGGELFGRYGYLARADPELMKRDHPTPHHSPDADTSSHDHPD